MIAIPGGTKKKPRLEMRKVERWLTQPNWTHFILKKKVRRSMPMMLEGSFMPVVHAMSSPKAKQPKMIKNCLAIRGVVVILSISRYMKCAVLGGAKLQLFGSRTKCCKDKVTKHVTFHSIFGIFL